MGQIKRTRRAVLALACAAACVAVLGQQPPNALSAAAREEWGTWKATDGTYIIEFPREWGLSLEDRTNCVQFSGRHARVSVQTAAAKAAETIEIYLEASQARFKRQCPKAEIADNGAATVAGFAGVSLTLSCADSPRPYATRIVAALKGGRVYSFNVTAPPAELPLEQAAIDRMERSFRPGPGTKAIGKQH